MGRKSINQTTRFEVFKRDSFTCQYCGAKAPDVVLEVDHIKPVAAGGENDVLNYVTSCRDCNGGKGARLLSDTSIVERQRLQIEDLEERRQQLQMMLEWRDELARFNTQIEETVCDHIGAVSGRVPNNRGKATVRRWIKNYPLETILSAIDDALDMHGDWRGDEMTSASWEKAFKSVPIFCRTKMRYGDGPEFHKLLYIQGIVRRRLEDRFFKALPALKAMVDAGFSIEDITAEAKKLGDENDFDAWIQLWLGEPVQ